MTDILGQIMSAGEVLERLEAFQQPVDLNDFYTDGELDLEKARQRGKLFLIKSLVCNECGVVVDITLHNASFGYVYLIRAANGLTKIGITNQFDKRLSQLRVSSPVSLEPLYCGFVNDAVDVERALHARFSDKHSHGEWFGLSQDDIDYCIDYISGYAVDDPRRRGNGGLQYAA